jgi:hypothetical protein
MRISVRDETRRSGSMRTGEVLGRHLEFARICLNDDLGWAMFDCSWEAIAHALNNNRPIIA